MAAGVCLLDSGNPCDVCENWPVKIWNKLRKALADAKTKAGQRGKPYWTSAFSHIEPWVTRSTASVAASEPGSDFTSLADSEHLLPTGETNVSTEESIVQDLEVHDNIEVNAKMADKTKANQVTLLVHLEQTIEPPMAHKKTPTAHKRAPMTHLRCLGH